MPDGLSRQVRLAMDEVLDDVRAHEKALNDVGKRYGDLDPNKLKTAESVYRFAFEQMGMPEEDYDEVDPSAYPTIFRLATRGSSGAANDSALRRRQPSAFMTEAMRKREG